VKPPKDEEALMKIREQEKLRKLNKQKDRRKVPLAFRKAEQAVVKNRSELNLKIKKAERNFSLLFSECKKILDKPLDD
jgi:hypothetical protein